MSDLLVRRRIVISPSQMLFLEVGVRSACGIVTPVVDIILVENRTYDYNFSAENVTIDTHSRVEDVGSEHPSIKDFHALIKS